MRAVRRARRGMSGKVGGFVGTGIVVSPDRRRAASVASTQWAATNASAAARRAWPPSGAHPRLERATELVELGRDDEGAVALAGMLRVVVLVVVLGAPVVGLGGKFGHHTAAVGDAR